MAAFRYRSGTWRVEVAKTDKISSRQIRLSRTYDPDKGGAKKPPQDAVDWANDIEAKIRKGEYREAALPKDMTFGEALERYASQFTPSKKGAAQELSRIRKWQRDALAIRPLKTIVRLDIQDWIDARLAVGTSPTTIRNDLSLISNLFLKAANRWGFEDLKNPVIADDLPRPGRARERRLDHKPDEDGKTEENRLLEACDNGPNYLGPMVRLALETAMRQGELLALEWKHIDLKIGVARLLDTKNGDRRDVPLSPAAITVLKAYPRNISGKLFSVGTMAVVHAFQRACKRAGIGDLRFHDLRHEATTRLFEKGFTIEEVRAITGHKTLAMLMRYTHLRAEDLAKKLG